MDKDTLEHLQNERAERPEQSVIPECFQGETWSPFVTEEGMKIMNALLTETPYSPYMLMAASQKGIKIPTPFVLPIPPFSTLEEIHLFLKNAVNAVMNNPHLVNKHFEECGRIKEYGDLYRYYIDWFNVLGKRLSPEDYYKFANKIPNEKAKAIVYLCTWSGFAFMETQERLTTAYRVMSGALDHMSAKEILGYDRIHTNWKDNEITIWKDLHTGLRSLENEGWAETNKEFVEDLIYAPYFEGYMRLNSFAKRISGRMNFPFLNHDIAKMGGARALAFLRDMLRLEHRRYGEAARPYTAKDVAFLEIDENFDPTSPLEDPLELGEDYLWASFIGEGYEFHGAKPEDKASLPRMMKIWGAGIQKARHKQMIEKIKAGKGHEYEAEMNELIANFQKSKIEGDSPREMVIKRLRALRPEANGKAGAKDDEQRSRLLPIYPELPTELFKPIKKRSRKMATLKSTLRRELERDDIIEDYRLAEVLTWLYLDMKDGRDTETLKLLFDILDKDEKIFTAFFELALVSDSAHFYSALAADVLRRYIRANFWDRALKIRNAGLIEFMFESRTYGNKFLTLMVSALKDEDEVEELLNVLNHYDEAKRNFDFKLLKRPDIVDLKLSRLAELKGDSKKIEDLKRNTMSSEERDSLALFVQRMHEAGLSLSKEDTQRRLDELRLNRSRPLLQTERVSFNVGKDALLHGKLSAEGQIINCDLLAVLPPPKNQVRLHMSAVQVDENFEMEVLVAQNPEQEEMFRAAAVLVMHEFFVKQNPLAVRQSAKEAVQETLGGDEEEDLGAEETAKHRNQGVLTLDISEGDKEQMKKELSEGSANRKRYTSVLRKALRGEEVDLSELKVFRAERVEGMNRTFYKPVTLAELKEWQEAGLLNEFLKGDDLYYLKITPHTRCLQPGVFPYNGGELLELGFEEMSSEAMAAYVYYTNAGMQSLSWDPASAYYNPVVDVRAPRRTTKVYAVDAEEEAVIRELANDIAEEQPESELPQEIRTAEIIEKLKGDWGREWLESQLEEGIRSEGEQFYDSGRFGELCDRFAFMLMNTAFVERKDGALRHANINLFADSLETPKTFNQGSYGKVSDLIEEA